MNKIRLYYYNLTTYVQFISLYLVFNNYYKYKINEIFYVVLFIVLFLCSLNYLITDYPDLLVKYKVSEDVQTLIKPYTKYFDESMTFIYILIIITILYYKKKIK